MRSIHQPDRPIEDGRKQHPHKVWREEVSDALVGLPGTAHQQEDAAEQYQDVDECDEQGMEAKEKYRPRCIQ